MTRSNAEVLLAIDCGTQSVRAMLFDPRGNLLARSAVPLDPYVSPQPGWAEQDPESYWRGLCRACHALWAETDVPREAIAAAALTGQRATVINVDEACKPLRPAIVWLDQRRTDALPPIGGLRGLALRVVGMGRTVRYVQAQAEANWIRTHQPEIWAGTHKFLFLSGYLTRRLTGRFVDSAACQVGYVPFDYRHLRWLPPDHWKCRVVPVEPAKLPELVAPAGRLGEITPAAGAETGIPAGLPLIAAAADKACEALGAGAVAPHVGCLSYGTAATVNTTHRRYIEVVPFLPPYPAAVPGAYSLEVQVYRGYWMVRWFKEQFAHPERQAAGEQGVAAETLFDELASASPPGAMGLVLQPYWSPGLKAPGPEAKGAVIGFGDVHTRADLYRAILEGLAYALREGLERTVRRSGVAVGELRVCGGGSRSDAAMQLTADVFGLPASRPHVEETSGLGAAIDAAVGMGLHADFAAAVGEMTRLGRTFEPDARTREVYEGLYRRVYRRMYRRLRPLYEEIRKITGYPAGL